VRKANAGWFKTGYDPRRHILTHEERSRGGRTTTLKFLVLGRWTLDWYDRCLHYGSQADLSRIEPLGGHFEDSTRRAEDSASAIPSQPVR